VFELAQSCGYCECHVTAGCVTTTRPEHPAPRFVGLARSPNCGRVSFRATGGAFMRAPPWRILPLPASQPTQANAIALSALPRAAAGQRDHACPWPGLSRLAAGPWRGM